MKNGRASHTSAGFTLIELMISVLLGAILMAGAISIYLASKRSYEEVEQVAALVENASYAEQIINDAVRHVGFFGEVPGGKVNIFPGTPAVLALKDCAGRAKAYDIANFLHAARTDGSGDAINCISGAVPDTDVLVIKRVRALPYTDGPRVFDPNEFVVRDGVIDTPDELTLQTTYVMTNRIVGELFESSNSVPVIANGVAWEYQFEAYYIRNAAVPKLSRMVLFDDGSGMTLRSEDVVEGVENMRLIFGYDSDGDGEADTYANVNDIGSNWGRVLSLEVFMLVRSATPDFQYEDEKTYTLGNDLTVTPTDLNFRRIVTRASASMRNPKLVIRGNTL